MTRKMLIDKLYKYVLYILNVNNTVRFGLLLRDNKRRHYSTQTILVLPFTLGR